MMTKYSDIKSTNMVWAKKIPSEWEIVRLKEVLAERKEKNNPIKTDFILSLTANQGVIPYSEKKSGGNRAKEDISKYNLARPDDLVINCMNVVAGSVGLSKYYGAISPVYYALYKRNDEVSIRYYNYIFQISTFQRSLISLGNGIMMKESSNGKLNTVRKRISMDRLNSVEVPKPPIIEQDKIVQYLDWKCSKINRIIRAKKKQIKLIKEQLDGIYNDLLFGRVGNLKKKDSNVVWMGEIPEHWDICTIKQLFSIKKDIAGIEGIDVISVTQAGLKIKDVENNEGQMAKSYANYQRVKYDDFVMNHMDLLTGWIDCAKIEGVTSPDYRVFVANDEKLIDREYYLALFQLFYKRKIFFGYGQGIATSGRWRLPKINFLNISVPLPPKEEQEKITEIIGRQTKKMFIMLNKIKEEIDLLNEYRTRLISDVVTGQIDVGDESIPSFEAEVDDIDEAIEDELADVEEMEEEVDADE